MKNQKEFVILDNYEDKIFIGRNNLQDKDFSDFVSQIFRKEKKFKDAFFILEFDKKYKEDYRPYWYSFLLDYKTGLNLGINDFKLMRSIYNDTTKIPTIKNLIKITDINNLVVHVINNIDNYNLNEMRLLIKSPNLDKSYQKLLDML